MYDPGERTLTYANAGHLPALLRAPGADTQRLAGASGPPLGAGPLTLTEHRIPLPAGAVVVLYTDGLVEHRDSDIDSGIDDLADALPDPATVIDDRVPDALAATLLGAEQDDDVAVLVAQVQPEDNAAGSAVLDIASTEHAVLEARHFVRARLRGWRVPAASHDDIILLTSELITNAIIHGRPPVQLRLRASRSHVVLEVRDQANYLPRRLRPTPDDEHGRGLQLVSLLSQRWGTRPVPEGKAVWCLCALDGAGGS